MAQIDYIHISLRAEVDSATRTVFSYPPSAEPQAWEKRLVTPAVAIKRFLNATECYVLQQWDDGHCFSFITSSNQHPETGYCMISVFVNAGCALKGRQLIDIFSGLKKALVEDNDRSVEAVDGVLSRAGVPVEPLHLLSWDFRPEAPATAVAEAAYRTFITMGELVEIFGYPSQPEYAGYRCVIVVPASASLRPGTKMTRITSPIRKLYTITAPAGVEVSTASAFDGDPLTVTYHRDGFDPVKETVTAGTPSAYTRIEGTTIRIREPRECGVRFVRRVPLVVRSSKGGDITGYTIAVNGRSVNTMEPFVEFTEKDLKSASTVEIKAASNNFAPEKIVKTTAEILATDSLEIELTPIEQGVVLRLDFGDDRVIEYFLSIERNTPEYNRLHAGTFHGFRAHRAVNQDPDDPRVIYNVDLRANAPKMESPTAVPRNKVPVFENVAAVTDETADADQDIDTTVPTVDTTTPADEIALAEEDVKRPSRTRIYLLAAAAAIVLLVVVLVFVIPSGKTIGSGLDDSPAQVAGTDSVTAVDPAAAPTTAPAAAPAASLGADAGYLNDNSSWTMSQLTSPAGTALMQAFRDGDIDAIAGNEYFATGVCTNSRARKALELMWRGKTGPTRGSITRAIKKATESGKIDLNNLVDRLARVQPHAEDANTLPLPTR